MKKIRIGCGAGFSGDRIEPAWVLAEKGDLDYLVLECLAERTIALAQQRKIEDPTKGYDPLLDRRIDLLLDALVRNKICLITNMGAANPIAAAEEVVRIAKRRNLRVKVAALSGDDVFRTLKADMVAIETGDLLTASGNLISANAYLGVDGILEALRSGADVIITGRVADPSLFLAPMIHEFGWKLDNYNMLAKGTVIGHLMECAGQITGGYYADPVMKPVPAMEILGHPFADVFEDGSAIISKVSGTGGVINLQTAKEQLLYEVVNPYEYYTPDVIADFTTVFLKKTGNDDEIQVTGGSGKSRPASYKVSVGYRAFVLGEGEITYAGANAVARAELAAETLKFRLGPLFPGLRIDLIGQSSVHGVSLSQHAEPYEIRLRVAGRTSTKQEAAVIGEEVEALYTNGPAGGGGVRKSVNEVVGIVSTLIDRSHVQHHVTIRTS